MSDMPATCFFVVVVVAAVGDRFPLKDKRKKHHHSIHPESTFFVDKNKWINYHQNQEPEKKYIQNPERKERRRRRERNSAMISKKKICCCCCHRWTTTTTTTRNFLIIKKFSTTTTTLSEKKEKENSGQFYQWSLWFVSPMDFQSKNINKSILLAKTSLSSFYEFLSVKQEE